MNSAAVIGRQLRQHQTTAGRTTSGPLVPPSPHKGRPRTPSHQPYHQQLPSPPTVSSQQQPTPSQQQQQHQQPKDQNKQQQQKGTRTLCQWIL
ncbi:hypothetical protein AVEN_35539-1 [Araneus ventricosus]|uniref:Uncharacterized protein n=1 Tax=Araneus ventricosus TaxID=182803 RepID=A0A4Y2HLK5_ARAVE|nr:hypothetical protein AVEN_35539-1 [Araneus ventricosus]